MKFLNEQEAFEWWEEAYYFSGGGYEGLGRCFDGRVEMFNEWVEDQGVTYLDDELVEFLKEYK